MKIEQQALSVLLILQEISNPMLVGSKLATYELNAQDLLLYFDVNDGGEQTGYTNNGRFSAYRIHATRYLNHKTISDVLRTESTASIKRATPQILNRAPFLIFCG